MISNLKRQQGQKFLFDNSFSEPIGPEAEIEEEDLVPPPPTFSEDEVASARAQGFVEGRNEGIAEMQNSIDQRLAVLMDDMVGQIRTLGEAQMRIASRVEAKMLSLALAVTKKVFPSIARAHADTVVENVIRECLPRLRDEPRIVLRIHPVLMDRLRGRIDTVAAKCGFPGDIILLPDDELTETDCKIEWSDGGAEKLADAVWAEIDRAVEAHVALVAASDPNEMSPAPARSTGEPGETKENLNG